MVLKSNTMIHDEGQDLCEHHDAMLPEPRHQRDNEFLKTLTSAHFILLGMNDKKKEGTWVWDSDGTPVDDPPWSPEEPNNINNQDCGGMWRKAGTWMDMGCGYDPNLNYLTRELICQQKGTYL